MEIPPINSRIYELALLKAYIEPIQITFEKISVAEKFVENITSNIKETKHCKSNKESTALNQDLKNQDVEELINVSIANGVIKIKTFNITYLNEYVKSKFSKLMEIKLFSKPSSEKTFKLELSTVTILFNLIISWEKLILQPNMCSPTSRIESEISELIFIICSKIKYDEFDNIANINNLNKNWKGCSVCVDE